MPRRSLWLIFAVAIFSLVCYERADHNPYGRWFSEALELIDHRYVEKVDDQKLFDGALVGMVRRLDDYSSFLTRSESPRFEEDLNQKYGGVGIEVNLDGPDRLLTVANPRVGGPAYEAGVRAGDRIVTIDGRATDKMELPEIVNLLRGNPGEPVTISVHRGDRSEPIEFRLTRAIIKIDSILGDRRLADGSWDFLLPGDERLGYIRLTTFGETTVEELDAALAWLTARKCRGVVLDLRNNPGGLLQVAQRVCDLFLPAGALVVSTRGRDGRELSSYTASGNGPYQKLPLVLLVNDKSASASEIVAAALQDHARATIVGQRTWGKGTVQDVIQLEAGKSLLKLTVASYWRPSGKNIHRLASSIETDEWGVKPDADFEVKLDEKQAQALYEKLRPLDIPLPADGAASAATSGQAARRRVDLDPQLKRAVEALERQLTSSASARA